MTDNVTAPGQHSNGYQQQAVTMSTPTKQVSSNGTTFRPIVQQYNSPQQLYSQENVEEVLNQQAEVLANGVKGINFAEDNKLDLSSSETLKLVQELDNTCQPSMEQGWSS